MCRGYDGSISAPVVADAEYEHRSSIHRRLMIAGGVMLGATWLANGIIGLFAGYHTTLLGSSSSSSFDPEWDAFRGVAWIPVLGPWIQLGLHSQTTGWNIWLSIDGLVQAAGFALLVAGAVLESENRPDHPAYVVLPMLGEGTAGLLFAGTL
jgi:hypothetical protein